MKQSKLFTKTQREISQDEKSINAQFLLKGGFIDKLAAGIYTYLPLGLRTLKKIQTIIREEMDKIDGQEILMPALNPKENWEKTGRWDGLDVLFKIEGTGSKEYALAASHEEIVTPLVQKFASSYKDLPVSVYQIQDKFRNEPRAKSGILRGREFNMKDMYSFHANEQDLEEYYENSKTAYLKVYKKCGLDAKIVESSGGTFSKYSHEFQVFTNHGEDLVFSCEKCNKHQNLEIAEGLPNNPEGGLEDEKELEKVEAKRENTIEASSKLMNIPAWKVLKNVVYMGSDGLVGVSIRGDLNVNLLKLQSYLEDFTLRQATPKKLEEAGLVMGFISPVNNDKIKFIGDLSVKTVNNYVTGANEKYQDYINVNEKDLNLKEYEDLAEIKEGFTCSKCEQPLKVEKAIEVGNIFKLKTKFSNAFNYTYQDKDGKSRPVIMGCYGIGPSRVMGAIVEVNHDEKGIIWPASIAPYHIHLVTLGKTKEVATKAEKLYNDLTAKGLEVLFDDRQESAGVKLNDSDLIGLPIRVILSEKTLKEDSVEVKKRAEKESQLTKISDLEKILKK